MDIPDRPDIEIEVKRQLEILRRGCSEIIDETELAERIRRSLIENRPLIIKLGADPSAPDLHLGHAVVLTKLRQFQNLGHRVKFLIGDFTGLVGDPSGKSKTRPQLTADEIAANAATYREQFSRILDPGQTDIVFNSSWLSQLSFQEVIELSAKYTVARMLERDDFEKRYKSNTPISVHEFFYPLMQGYDSVALEADVELGGTDQKFNLLVGRDLQREYGQKPQIIMMMPILVGLDGVQKMSKSLGNYVGVCDDATEMFGKLMSIPDDIMWNYFELLTEVPLSELQNWKTEMNSGQRHPMELKKLLAETVSARFHNQEAAAAARTEFENVFSRRKLPTDAPEYSIPGIVREDGTIWLVSLLSELKLVKSNSDARRLIKQGAVKINGEKSNGEEYRPREDETSFLIQAGKHKFAQVKF